MTVRDLIEIMATVDFRTNKNKYRSENEAYRYLVEGYFIYPREKDAGLIFLPYEKRDLPKEKSLNMNTIIEKRGILFRMNHDFGFNEDANTIEVGWWSRQYKAFRCYEITVDCEAYKIDFVGFVDVEKSEVIYEVDKKVFIYEKGLSL